MVSTHSPRGGRTCVISNGEYDTRVSTHSPRGGRTRHLGVGARRHQGFQLTRPAGGEPPSDVKTGVGTRVSTHSPRGGRTNSSPPLPKVRRSFNSLAPRGANPVVATRRGVRHKFQLTRPAGGEPKFRNFVLRLIGVSTHSPRGGRTLALDGAGLRRHVSTHSPRGGRTRRYLYYCRTVCSFNSLAPRGANPCLLAMLLYLISFQLTRPAGGEPGSRERVVNYLVVSTHSPRGGRTLNSSASVILHLRFNSLAPRGANHEQSYDHPRIMPFQLTRPAGGEPGLFVDNKPTSSSFNSLAPRGANQSPYEV